MSASLSNIDSAKQSQRRLSSTNWSISRMQVLDACPRKYYYQYFAGKKTVDSKGIDKDTINFLKQFSNEHLIAGDIVHWVIRAYFKNLMKPDPWDLARLKSFALRILKDGIDYSTELRDGIYKPHKFIPRSLQEIYYNEQAPAVISGRIKQKIDHLLNNFYNSECYASLRIGALNPGSMVEKKIGFDFPGVHVDGIADLIYSQDERWIITDWKTGTKETEETSLQLLVYGLWLIEEKGISPELILINKAYLNEAVLEPLEFSKVHIQRARGRIIQDVERLKELEDFGNEGVIEAFTPCNQQKVCMQCPFKKLCIIN